MPVRHLWLLLCLLGAAERSCAAVVLLKFSSFGERCLDHTSNSSLQHTPTPQGENRQGCLQLLVPRQRFLALGSLQHITVYKTNRVTSTRLPTVAGTVWTVRSTKMRRRWTQTTTAPRTASPASTARRWVVDLNSELQTCVCLVTEALGCRLRPVGAASF